MWRKSTYSFSNGNCAEVAAWRKSSLSTFNGNCTEVAASASGVLVRDSQLAGASPVLRFGGKEWAVFLAGLKRRQEGCQA